MSTSSTTSAAASAPPAAAPGARNAERPDETRAIPGTGDLEADLAGPCELFAAPFFRRWQNGAALLDHAHADLVVRALRPDVPGEGQAPAVTE